MSKRLRNRPPDKRDTALELARPCGWGTDMPSEDEAPAEDDEQGRELDAEPDCRASGPAPIN